MSDIAYSITNLIEAVTERDEARGKCDHSWGYFGQQYEDRVRDATKSLEDDIRKIVADEVRRIIGGGVDQ